MSGNAWRPLELAEERSQLWQRGTKGVTNHGREEQRTDPPRVLV